MRYLSCLILCCFACKKDKLNAKTAADCSIIADAEILQEDQLPCNYNEVYQYKGDIYTRCVCCLCSKLSMPINCEGEPLCEFTDDCLTEFEEKAKYLFSVEELE